MSIARRSSGSIRRRTTTALAFVASIGWSACGVETDGVEMQTSGGAIFVAKPANPSVPIDPLGPVDPSGLIEFDNDRGEPLVGVLLRPDANATGPGPGVIVLHGSGGLFVSPKNKHVELDESELELSPQFDEWADMLLEHGYTVLMPSSFYSRGYFEWDDHPRSEEIDKVERLVMRVHDAYAALRFMCGLYTVDCERVGVVGFSNGGSVALFAQHEDLDAIPGMSTLPPVAERERFAIVTSFYPGCGFQGLLDSPYFPITPVDVYHGARDPLLEHCPTRLAEVEDEAEQRMISPPPMTLRIYEGAGHSFDYKPHGKAEREARDDARERTLERLAQVLSP